MKFYVRNLTKYQEEKVKDYVESRNLGRVNSTDAEIRIDVDSEKQEQQIIKYIKENIVSPVMVIQSHLSNKGQIIY